MFILDIPIKSKCTTVCFVRISKEDHDAHIAALNQEEAELEEVKTERNLYSKHKKNNLLKIEKLKKQRA